PRRPEDMSRVDVRERCRDSPDRARSFCTVRAAISFARPSEVPRCRCERLTCSYCLARFVPFLTPRGGIWCLLLGVAPGYTCAGGANGGSYRRRTGIRRPWR